MLDQMVNRYHVMKTDENHTDTPVCWCEPELIYKDPDNGNEVWLHREVQ